MKEYAINNRTENQTVYYIYISAETILQMNLMGNSRGIFHASQGGLYELSPLRSGGSHGIQGGRLGCINSVLRCSKESKKLL
jgi:hypothetical protein